MRQIIRITLILLLFSFKGYCQDKKTDVKFQENKTSEKTQTEKDEYSPEKSITFNPNVLAILDDKVVSFGYVSDYCYEKKLGDFFRVLTSKEGIFYYGERGRYGVILAKTIK